MNSRTTKVRDTRGRVTVPFLDFILNGHRTARASACGIRWLNEQRADADNVSLNRHTAELLACSPAWRLSLHAESCSIATSVVGYLDHIHHQHPLLLLVDPVAGRRRILNQGDRLEFRKGHSVAWEAEFELLVDLGKAITLQDEVESWQKWKRACKALPETRRAPYLVPTYFRQRIQQEVQP